MPRMAGIVIPGQAHPVVQRGNNRQDVFFVDDDRSGPLDARRGIVQTLERVLVQRLQQTGPVHDLGRSGTARALLDNMPATGRLR